MHLPLLFVTILKQKQKQNEKTKQKKQNKTKNKTKTKKTKKKKNTAFNHSTCFELFSLVSKCLIFH